VRRDSSGVDRTDSRDSTDRSEGLLTGVNAEGAAPWGLEDSLGTGSIMTELRSRGPCRLVLDICRTGGCSLNVLRFESIMRTVLGIDFVGVVGLDGSVVAGGVSVVVVVVVLIESTRGALYSVVFIGVGGLGLFVGGEIGASNTTRGGGSTAGE
jgi:hypothetical protein